MLIVPAVVQACKPASPLEAPWLARSSRCRRRGWKQRDVLAAPLRSKRQIKRSRVDGGRPVWCESPLRLTEECWNSENWLTWHVKCVFLSPTVSFMSLFLFFPFPPLFLDRPLLCVSGRGCCRPGGRQPAVRSGQTGPLVVPEERRQSADASTQQWVLPPHHRRRWEGASLSACHSDSAFVCLCLTLYDTSGRVSGNRAG